MQELRGFPDQPLPALLNRLLYLAVDKEILRVNPCEDLEYETKPEARHRYISREEFKKILSIPMYDKRMELARRAFIFSTMTGLAYVDIKLLHPTISEQTLMADGTSASTAKRQRWRRSYPYIP